MNATDILKVKTAVRSRDGNKCVDCGMTREEHYVKYGTKLHVHRLTPGSIYTVDGCVAVCKKHHKGRHRFRPAKRECMAFDCPARHRRAILIRKGLSGARTMSHVILAALEQYLPDQLEQADKAIERGNPPPKPRRGRKPGK